MVWAVLVNFSQFLYALFVSVQSLQTDLRATLFVFNGLS